MKILGLNVPSPHLLVGGAVSKIMRKLPGNATRNRDHKTPAVGEKYCLAAWGASPRNPNLGDTMAGFLIRKALDVVPIRTALTDSPKLLAVGSVIKFAKDFDVVWGSGSLTPHDLVTSSAQIIAVRGPRTAKLIVNSDVPSVYGDPAMLLPDYYTPPSVGERSAVAFIPHYADYPEIKKIFPKDPALKLIKLARNNWKHVVTQIVKSEMVVSSSLHGIIIAEAYGIPAIWVRISDKVVGGEHKFLDYYEAFSREGKRFEFEGEFSTLERKASEPPGFNLENLRGSALKLRTVINQY